MLSLFKIKHPAVFAISIFFAVLLSPLPLRTMVTLTVDLSHAPSAVFNVSMAEDLINQTRAEWVKNQAPISAHSSKTLIYTTANNDEGTMGITADLIRQIKSDWLRDLPPDTLSPGKVAALNLAYARVRWLLKLLNNTEGPHPELVEFWVDQSISVSSISAETPLINENWWGVVRNIIGVQGADKIKNLTKQYQKHYKNVDLLKHHPGFTNAERKDLIRTADLPGWRLALKDATSEAFQEIARTPENWRRLKAEMYGYLNIREHEIMREVSSEKKLIHSMGLSIYESEDLKFRLPFLECYEKSYAVERMEPELLVGTLGPGVRPGDVLNGESISNFMPVLMEYMACMAKLAVHPQVKNKERNQFLINMTLGIRDFLRRADILVSGGQRALALDVLVNIAKSYQASLRWDRRYDISLDIAVRTQTRIEETIQALEEYQALLLTTDTSQNLIVAMPAYFQSHRDWQKNGWLNWRWVAQAAFRKYRKQARIVSYNNKTYLLPKKNAFRRIKDNNDIDRYEAQEIISISLFRSTPIKK